LSFRVIKPGFFSTIQDRGRFGLAHHGLSQSGVADEHAYCWANYLLGNDIDAAVMEITFGGCVLSALTDTGIAVTGADLGFKINGKYQPNWQVLSVKEGDLLTWSAPKNGVRAYLAVQDGFQTKQYFNSRSVNLREKIGSLIQVNHESLSRPSKPSDKGKTMPAWFKPNYTEALTLRLLSSYQYEKFSKQQRQMLFGQTYKIGKASDRTGCRLEGSVIENTPATMISEGITYGSVEITTAGLPIILLKDAPTIGGYPKIGTVLSLDLAKLAQRQSGCEVRFELIDIETAQRLRREFDQFFAK
jgi:biotin-dependent carboxylase-like uncharacterized protein